MVSQKTALESAQNVRLHRVLETALVLDRCLTSVTSPNVPELWDSSYVPTLYPTRDGEALGHLGRKRMKLPSPPPAAQLSRLIHLKVTFVVLAP